MDSLINKFGLLRLFMKANSKTILLFIICQSGLFYQTHLLLDEYLSGSTVVSIDVVKHQSDNLPAITFCLPVLFSMKSQAELIDHPILKSLYSHYISDYDNVSDEQIEQVNIDKWKIFEFYKLEFDYYSIAPNEALNNYSIQLDK